MTLGSNRPANSTVNGYSLSSPQVTPWTASDGSAVKSNENGPQLPDDPRAAVPLPAVDGRLGRGLRVHGIVSADRGLAAPAQGKEEGGGREGRPAHGV